jgi:hypothetical protein
MDNALLPLSLDSRKERQMPILDYLIVNLYKSVEVSYCSAGLLELRCQVRDLPPQLAFMCR